MKILFVWTGVTSYMADCWRRLQQKPDVELKIVVERARIGREFDENSVLRDLDRVVVEEGGAVAWEPGYCPDALYAAGWHSKVVRAAVMRKEWKAVPKILCLDMPWRLSLRCLLARFVLGPYLRRHQAAYVPGRSCERYVKWLGFKLVEKGLYGIDVDRFRPLAETDSSGGRKGFLFVGRHAPEKGLDTLGAAYEIYREMGGRWDLTISGWVAPENVPGVMREHACLLVPSRWEPWGVVVAEAKACGLAVIASDCVGARLDIPCEGVFKTGDSAALAREMLAVERGERVVKPLPDGYDCAAWVERTWRLLTESRGANWSKRIRVKTGCGK